LTAPKKLNKIQLAMELWQEDAQMSCSLNYFLNKIFLFQEVRLKFQNPFVAAVSGTSFALAFALSVQSNLVKPLFLKDSLDPFWLVLVFGNRMVCRKDHGLINFLPIRYVPAIMYSCLLPPCLDIHV
jgi:hypothetical protein